MGKRSTAPGRAKAVQTLGHHTPVSALMSMQVFWIKPSVFISECWFSKYENGKLLLQVKMSCSQPKTSGHKCLKQQTITHMVMQQHLWTLLRRATLPMTHLSGDKVWNISQGL